MRRSPIILFSILLLFSMLLTAQVELKATDTRNTYEFINSVLAHGANVIETPGNVRTTFDPHIDQSYNEELNNYVFQFLVRTIPDNDRCQKFNRQRTEIKTYSSSPNNLKATIRETVVYKLKFKLDAEFQPSSSFTQIHQIKTV